MSADIYQFPDASPQPKPKPDAPADTFFAVVAMHMSSKGMIPFFRLSERHVAYSFEEGDGPKFWAYDGQTDDIREHTFNAEQILATDWSF